MKQVARAALLWSLSLVVTGCSTKPQLPRTESEHSDSANTSHSSANPLIGRIWRLPNSPYGAAAGSIYIFLPNGTLLETSCVETYRIATWMPDKNNARTVHVVEDQHPAFDATVMQSSGESLQLRQTLAMGNRETRDLSMTAIDKEFVCPDLRK